MKTTASPVSGSREAISKKKILFQLYAPHAQGVTLSGSFNLWDGKKHPMKKDQSGMWKKTLTLPPGEHQYRFLVDDHWENDPSCLATVANGFGGQNNIVVVA